MKRTPSHRTGALAENMVEGAFLAAGWVVYRCRPDYGFDLLVHPCTDQHLLMDVAFLQVKATERGLRTLQDGRIPLRIHSKHLRLWEETVIPSYLCLVEVPAGRMFLARTWHFTDTLRLAHGEDYDQTRTTHTLHFPSGTLLQGDRLQRMQSAIARSWDAMRGAVLGLAQAPPKPCAPDIADGTGVVIWRASRGHAEAELDVALPEPEAERVYEGTGLLETGLWAHASHLFSCGRYREAIQVWQELAPSSRRIGASTLHFCMGCAELKLGDVESAQRAFATAYSEGYLRLELITERVVDSLRDAPGFGKVEHWFDRL